LYRLFEVINECKHSEVKSTLVYLVYICTCIEKYYNFAVQNKMLGKLNTHVKVVTIQ